MIQFEITEEEKLFIVKRRELAAKRKKLRHAVSAPKKEVKKETPKQANGWDAHTNPCQIHRGRMTPEHPLHWFEEEIFAKITNLQHKEQHKLIRSLLKMPVQNVFRDRQYHSLVHIESLWQQQLLPLSYKIRAEEYKAKFGIGQDFVHPKHKELKPDYVHPSPVLKRPWDAEKYGEADMSEKFIVGKKYIYDYDKEIGYDYTKQTEKGVWKEEE